MNLIDYFRRNRKKSAAVAKERLQILLAHEQGDGLLHDYLPQLKQDILEVVARYVEIQPEDVRVQVEHEDGCEILELNITLPEPPGPKVAAR